MLHAILQDSDDDESCLPHSVVPTRTTSKKDIVRNDS